MTLADFFNVLSNNPSWVIIYFISLPILALLLGFFTGQNGINNPWRYIYSGIIYAASLPGVFAITLSVYLFFFERKSIMQTNMVTQVLPVASMLLTFYVIRKFVNLNYIPGFGKLGNLVTMLIALMLLLWILEKTHIMVFTYMPFQYFLLLLVGILVVVRFSWSRISK